MYIIWVLLLCFTSGISNVFCDQHFTYNRMTEDVIKAYLRLKAPDILRKEYLAILEPFATVNTKSWSLPTLTAIDSNTTFPYRDEVCENHTAMVIEGLANRETWAWKMIDATAKIPNDVLEGNMMWYGSYDECKRVRAVVRASNQSGAQEVFGGQYCNAFVPINLANSNNLFQGLAAYFLQIGFCLPDSCTYTGAKNEIDLVIMSLGAILNRTMISAFLDCKTDPEIDDVAITAIVVLSFLVSLAVIGTAYDVIAIQLKKYFGKLAERPYIDPMEDVGKNEKTPLIIDEKPTKSSEPGTFGKLLLAFSLYSNAKKLLNTTTSSESLTAVNGIRFLSITWVVLGHTYSTSLSYASNTNVFMPEVLNRWTFQVISNALVSVDSFFALSGLLLSYLTLKEMEKRRGKLNWAMFYFHRFWRLTPPYMLVLLMDVGLVRYLGDGPIWPKGGFEQDQCKDTWWWNLLYINNFEIEKNKQMCMGWSWYLANDMQFFVLSPLMLIPLYYLEVVGVLICVAFIVGTWITTGVISSHYDMAPSIFGGGGNLFGVEDYMKYYYYKPYCRMGPYVVGILTGYLLYKYKGKFKISKILNFGLWCIAAAAALVIIYGLYGPINNEPLNTDISALYNATHRTVWGACVCWVIFACATGYGGFVNTILSWKAFVPLARLSYCVYLVHLLVLMVHYANYRRSIYLESDTMVFLFLGNLIASNLIAFVTSLLFEAPMMGLEKVIFRKSDNRGKSTV